MTFSSPLYHEGALATATTMAAAMVIAISMTTKTSSQNITSCFCNTFAIFPVWKCWQKKNLPSVPHVIEKTQDLVISRWCFAEDVKMSLNVKRHVRQTFLFSFSFCELNLWFCELNLSVSYRALENVVVAVLGAFSRGTR